MTIRTEHYLMCNNCSRLLYDTHGEWAFEEIEDLVALAERQGWGINIEVPNGAKWDICPSCLKGKLR